MTFDVILQNGKIIDGKGNPWKLGDVAIKDGRLPKWVEKYVLKHVKKLI